MSTRKLISQLRDLEHAARLECSRADQRGDGHAKAIAEAKRAAYANAIRLADKGAYANADPH